MVLKKCGQMKCSFNIFGGCKACKQCKAPPNIVDEDCDVCWNCEHDEGLLRWDEGSLDNHENHKINERDQEIKEKPMEVMMK